MARTVNVEEGVYKKNVRIEDIKGKMKREADQKINLVSDKMELEFMIQDQKEAQESLKKEFERLTREKKIQIEKLDQVNTELDTELEKSKARKETLANEVGEMKQGIEELVDENGLLENELKNLGEKTNSKISDMQKRMDNNIRDLESCKGKNENEIRHLNEATKEKLDRMNDDFSKRVEMMKEKLVETQKDKQDVEMELLRLQDIKRKEEANLETELNQRKNDFYEDSATQFNTVMKILKNNKRQLEEDRKVKTRKLEELTEEADLMRKEYEDEVNLKQVQDEELREEIKQLRAQVTDNESKIENDRAELYETDSELQRVQAEMQKNRFELKQTHEKGDYRLKELKHRFQVEREEKQGQLQLIEQKNRELDMELHEIEKKIETQRILNQKTINSMKAQLGQNIFQTINQHKESRVNVPVNYTASKGASFYLNNNK